MSPDALARALCILYHKGSKVHPHFPCDQMKAKANTLVAIMAQDKP